MKKNIPQIEPIFGEEERIALNTYMQEGGWVTEFKKTQELENMIASYTGAKHCVMVNNGTVSLILAAIACDINQGDEVLIPNYTMVATPNSVKILGAKPVFVDIEDKSLCIDLNDAKKKLTSKTKALVLVSSNGRYPAIGIEKVKQFCLENNLFLIEDAAQSLGSFYPNKKHIGTEGIIGSFSFSPAKIISTGQGGALITNNENIAKKLKYLKDFGRSKGGNDIHDYIGFNFKFTDIQAVIGIEQMKKLDERVSKKKDIYHKYVSRLIDNKNFYLVKNDTEYTTPWFIELISENRDELINFLSLNGIGTRVMYPPINKQKAYGENIKFPISDMIGNKGLWLPSSVNLNQNDIEYISTKIEEFYK